MKRILTLIICLSMLASAAFPVSANGVEEVVAYRETVLDNGITLIEEIVVQSNARGGTRQASASQTFKQGETVIAVIAFKAMFRFDGLKSTVLSKEVTRTDTYDGWSYTQHSFSSVADTVTLTGKLSKLIVLTMDVNMSLTCDANGNIS